MKKKAETKKEETHNSKLLVKNVPSNDTSSNKTENAEKKILKPIEAIKYVKLNSKKRKFVQSFDMIISLKNVNLKKPENRFSFEVTLPEGRGKNLKVAFIGDSLAQQAKNYVDVVIKKSEIEKYAKNKKLLKKLVKEYDRFLAEAPLMPLIGKHFGIVMGPRGKLPKPVPPGAKLGPIIEASKRMIRVSLRDTPVIQVPIGTEKMEDDKLLKNLNVVYNAVKDRLPKGKNNIRAVFLKLTMSPPVKVEM